MLGAFSRNGRIPVLSGTRSLFVDDSFGGAGSDYAYSASSIAAHGARAEVEEPVVAALLRAYARFVTKVVVLGSQKPGIEGLLLRVNARARVLTVEYNRLALDHPRVRVVRGNALPARLGRVRLAVAVDALQHDGLGRYGDPVCPDADLVAMDRLRNRTSLLLLSVPTAERDAVVWNAHRVYGPLRLPLLLRGWTVLERRPWDNGVLKRTVFMLRPDSRGPDSGSSDARSADARSPDARSPDARSSDARIPSELEAHSQCAASAPRPDS